MPTQPLSSYSPPLKAWLSLGLPLLLMVLLLTLPHDNIDFAITDLFYTAGTGFAGKHSYFLENILHERAKEFVILLGLMAVLGLISSFVYRPWRWLRLPLGYLVLSISITTAIVTPLKVVTGVQCPWDLTEYGGTETYSSLLSARAPTSKPGKCWPAGHATSGFVFFSLYFVLRDRRPRLAKTALVFAFALGSLLGLGRIMQGAHFLSHNIWTALFDWMIALGCYHLLLYRPQPTLQASATKKPIGGVSRLSD